MVLVRTRSVGSHSMQSKIQIQKYYKITESVNNFIQLLISATKGKLDEGYIALCERTYKPANAEFSFQSTVWASIICRSWHRRLSKQFVELEKHSCNK